MTVVYRSDKVFKEKFAESHDAVVKVGEWLKGHGFDAVVQPQVLRPDVSQREEYTDDYDIHVFEDGELVAKVDAKGNPTYSFSEMNPWPYGSMICQSVYDVSRKGFPHSVFQVNKELTWAVFMDITKIKEYLFKREVFNKSTKKKQMCWCLPKKYFMYIDLNR